MTRISYLLFVCLTLSINLQTTISIRRTIDPVVSNYKLVLDLDVACAFNYSVDEMRDMYSNAGVPVNPNTFESAFPAVHYSIYHMKLDVFEFLLVSGADIDSIKDKEGCTLLDLIHKRHRSGHINKQELVDIYRIVKSKVGAVITAKFNRQVLLREVYDVLGSGENEDIVILSLGERGKYREVVNDVVSTFKVKVDLDVACALSFSREEIISIHKNEAIDGNVFFSCYPAAQYVIRQGNVDLLNFLLGKCGVDIDVTRDKRGRNLVEFLVDCRKELSTGLFSDVYKCVCTHSPYMKVNVFERKLLLDAFYASLQTAISEVRDVSYSLPKERLLELKVLIPAEVSDPPHIEPDVAHLMGYSHEVVLDMVARGADVFSVATGFPILSRYINEGNCSAVSRLIELSGLRCNVLFVCDKTLKLPLDYVKREGKRYCMNMSAHTDVYSHVLCTIDMKSIQAIIAYSNVDLTLADPLLVFRVTPWSILFPFVSALGAGDPLLQVVDEVCTLHVYVYNLLLVCWSHSRMCIANICVNVFISL